MSAFPCDACSPFEYHDATWRAVEKVFHERMRQEKLKAEGRFEYTCADNGMNHYERFAVLGEEVGEVAQEVLTQAERRLARDTEGTLEALRKEIVQVAAVSVAWIEALDRQISAAPPGQEKVTNERT